MRPPSGRARRHGEGEELDGGVGVRSAAVAAGAATRRRRRQLRQVRRVADDDVDAVRGPQSCSRASARRDRAVGAERRASSGGRRLASMSHADETAAGRRARRTRRRRGGEEPAVAARRVDARRHGRRSAGDVDRRGDDEVDEPRRRRVVATPLARSRAVREPALQPAPRTERRVGAVIEAESRFLTIGRDDWAALRAATPLTLREDDLAKLRGINERIDLDEVAADLPPAVAAAEPLRQRVAGPRPGVVDVPRHDGAAGAVRDRRRRQRRRRQEHVRPHPPGAARPLARPPAGRPRHHRRVPVPQRRARRARA